MISSRVGSSFDRMTLPPLESEISMFQTSFHFGVSSSASCPPSCTREMIKLFALEFDCPLADVPASVGVETRRPFGRDEGSAALPICLDMLDDDLAIDVEMGDGDPVRGP